MQTHYLVNRRVWQQVCRCGFALPFGALPYRALAPRFFRPAPPEWHAAVGGWRKVRIKPGRTGRGAPAAVPALGAHKQIRPLLTGARGAGLRMSQRAVSTLSAVSFIHPESTTRRKASPISRRS